MPIARMMNGSDWAPVSSRASETGIDKEILSAPIMAMSSLNSTKFTPTVRCDTGNCTWSSYTTLAICSTCKDLTDDLQQSKHEIVTGKKNNIKVASNSWEPSNGFGLGSVQFASQLNPVWATFSTAMMNVTTTASLQNTISGWSENTVPYLWEPIAFPDSEYGSKVFSVIGVYAQPATIPTQSDWDYTNDPMTGKGYAAPIATECMFQYCIRRMHATFINSTLYESVDETYINETKSILYNSRNYLTAPFSGQTFTLEPGTHDTFRSWLQYILNGSTTIQMDGNKWVLGSPQQASSDVASLLYSHVNESKTAFPEYMSRVADAITVKLRSVSYQEPSIHGKAFGQTSQAVVTWEWLILPVFELTTGLILLFVVIIQTKSAGLRPWTNSVLPYLFHGFDQRPSDRGPHEDLEFMKQEAEQLLVEYREHDAGGGLFKVL